MITKHDVLIIIPKCLRLEEEKNDPIDYVVTSANYDSHWIYTIFFFFYWVVKRKNLLLFLEMDGNSQDNKTDENTSELHFHISLICPSIVFAHTYITHLTSQGDEEDGKITNKMCWFIEGNIIMLINGYMNQN